MDKHSSLFRLVVRDEEKVLWGCPAGQKKWVRRRGSVMSQKLGTFLSQKNTFYSNDWFYFFLSGQEKRNHVFSKRKKKCQKFSGRSFLESVVKISACGFIFARGRILTLKKEILFLPKNPFTVSSHFGAVPFYRGVVLSNCHFVKLLFWQVVVLSSCHFGAVPFYRHVI